jgi:D-threo-aldose 1-dehydrogenase
LCPRFLAKDYIDLYFPVYFIEIRKGSNPRSPAHSLPAIAVLGTNLHRPLGGTGWHVPPIVFGTAALGNVGRVITEQAKLAIIGEWFQQVAPPVFIEAAYEHGDGMALEVLGRVLRRLDVASDEVVIQLTVGERVAECWEKSCRLLGEAYRPKLVAVRAADEDGLRAARELQAAGEVRGVGVVASDWRAARDCPATGEADWITLAGGCTVMRHPPEVLAFLVELANRQIPVIVTGVFDCGFLVGGSRLDGRVVSAENPADRSLFAWRKAFVALCDGHSITPAHACIQFALALPGVVAVRLDSSYSDRVAANIGSAYAGVPEKFWESMEEEGLLGAGSR